MTRFDAQGGFRLGQLSLTRLLEHHTATWLDVLDVNDVLMTGYLSSPWPLIGLAMQYFNPESTRSPPRLFLLLVRLRGHRPCTQIVLAPS